MTQSRIPSSELGVNTAAASASVAPAGQPLIGLKNISKAYRARDLETVALDDVSIEIKAGEFVAVMGPL